MRRSYAMTGMPASLAFLSAGRIALLSCASRTRTLAPLLISVSISDSCFSLFRFASGSPTIVPPPSWMALNIDGLSVAAQRGCWKLFHEMPTLQPVAVPPLPPGAADPPLPLPPHAARTNIPAAMTAPSFRLSTVSSSNYYHEAISPGRRRSLGYSLLLLGVADMPQAVASRLLRSRGPSHEAGS